MFLPSNLKNQSEEDKADAERKKAYVRIEQWAINLIPESIRTGVQVNVQEIVCGDPECAPIDTAVAVLFPRGGRGMMGLPMEAKDVKPDDLKGSFPTEDVLMKWSRGEEADWPPDDDLVDEQQFQAPQLRFEIGQRVECRIGPEEETGWAKGIISQLWYREPSWPPNSWAPYKIKLENGKDIFAPADLDHVIRAARS